MSSFLLRLDIETHKALKIEAIKRDTTMTELINKLIERELELTKFKIFGD